MHPLTKSSLSLIIIGLGLVIVIVVVVDGWTVRRTISITVEHAYYNVIDKPAKRPSIIGNEYIIIITVEYDMIITAELVNIANACTYYYKWNRHYHRHWIFGTIIIVDIEVMIIITAATKYNDYWLHWNEQWAFLSCVILDSSLLHAYIASVAASSPN